MTREQLEDIFDPKCLGAWALHRRTSGKSGGWLGGWVAGWLGGWVAGWLGGWVAG